MGNAVFVVPFSFGYFPDSHRVGMQRKVTYEDWPGEEPYLQFC